MVWLWMHGELCAGSLGDVSHLSRARHAQRRQKTVAAFPSFGTKHALDERKHAGAVEDVDLGGIVLKDARESEAFDGSLAAVVLRRLDRNVVGEVLLRVFDVEKAVSSGRGGGAETQVHLE